MAKKRTERKEAAKPARQQKTTSNTGMIVGIIVVAIVIIALIVLLRGGKQAPSTTGPTAPTAPTTEPGKKFVELAATPDFNTKCTSADKVTAVTLSYMPGSCKISDGTVSFTMKNPSSKTDVEGIYFEATSTSGKKSYIVDKEVVSPGNSKTYTVSLSDLASAIGESVTDFVAYPAQSGKACLNSRSIVIKSQTCV